jgi:hypothetical protein
VRTRPALIAFLFALALAGSVPELAVAQCAMCKTALEGSAEGRTMQGELNRAILLMLVAPYVIFGGFTVAVFRKPLGERLSRWNARLRR